MISINKYGQNIDLSNVQELNGKKSYSLDNIDSSKTLLIKIPQGVKFVTTLQDEDLKVNFTDKEGNVFELILKNISDILVQNDGDKLIEIIREESNEILASITDLASALEATAAGGEQAQGNQTSTNSDSGRVNEFENDGLDFEENSYPNDRVFEDASSQETTVTQPALSSLNNLIDEEQVLNSAPTIEVNSTLTVDEDNSTTITFTLNDIDGDILTSNATAINGVVTINGNVITYTPNENFNGNDVITLSVNDGTVTTTQTINVTINPVNDAPTIEVNSTLTVDEDDTTTIIFVSNDIDGDTLTSNATAINGVVTINGNVITYTPNENFNGNDVITLSVNDGTVTTTQTINVTINPVNDAPTIEIQENSLLENIILEGQLTASDIDTNFANLIFSTIEVIDGFVLNTDGSYTFDANKYDYLAEGEILELAIPITVTDDFNASASSVLNIKITGTNDRPIINVEPIIELSETDLSSTATLPDVYYVISEAELFEMLEITDVDSNDGLSLSLVSNSSVFTSVNAGITEGINGVVQLTQERIDALGIEANVGDFFVFSNGFDGLGENEIANVSFEVVAIDNSGAENAMSEIKKVSIVITGTNDRPIINVEPIIELSETDLSSTATLPDVYYVISEAELFEMLEITDVDSNDGLSLSLVSNSSVFTSVNAGITEGINGVVQLTQERIDALGIEANVGDFFVFSNGFDGLGENEIANVSFEVVAIDNSGAENAMSEIKKVSIVITGTNDRLVTSVVYTQIQNDDTSKVYKGQLSAKDVDLNDTLTYSIDNTSVNVALTISNINGLSTLTNLNTSALESVFQDIKPVVTNFIATGDLSGLLTLNPQTIATTKTAVVILQGLLNSNPDLKNSIVLLKDFVVANQDSIIENTSLVAQDIVLLQDLLTQENLTALGNLYNSLNLFIYNNPQIKDLATSILADNIISPSELMSIDPVLLVQIEALRVQLKSIIDSNSNILELISITQVIEKLQEVVTIDTTNNQVSIESKVTPTLAGMILTLDEDTGEYIVNNAFAEKFSSLGNLEISFDYNATDSQGTTDSSTASILITTEEINDTSISLDDGGILSFGEEQNINLGDLLENISTSVEIQDIDSIDLSNSEHILSNLTIKDFEDMVADDSSNTLVIDGENNDKIKLDLSVWSKDENDKDINTINESEDDGYITYTAKGTAEQTLTLLIDKDIVVENI
jgi:VCBS repeat-containing protein